jgi:endogenous inhibitor of DNA gyrase (YacG/DUF329 family)
MSRAIGPNGCEQDRCHGCGRWLPLDDGEHFFHCSERCESADEWDMHPVAPFCSESCADRFHNAPRE